MSSSSNKYVRNGGNNPFRQDREFVAATQTGGRGKRGGKGKSPMPTFDGYANHAVEHEATVAAIDTEWSNTHHEYAGIGHPDRQVRDTNNRMNPMGTMAMSIIAMRDEIAQLKKNQEIMARNQDAIFGELRRVAAASEWANGALFNYEKLMGELSDAVRVNDAYKADLFLDNLNLNHANTSTVFGDGVDLYHEDGMPVFGSFTGEPLVDEPVEVLVTTDVTHGGAEPHADAEIQV